MLGGSLELQAVRVDRAAWSFIPRVVVSSVGNDVDQIAVRNGNPAAAIARATGVMNLGHVLSFHQFLATRISVACNVTVYHREHLLFVTHDCLD